MWTVPSHFEDAETEQLRDTPLRSQPVTRLHTLVSRVPEPSWNTKLGMFLILLDELPFPRIEVACISKLFRYPKPIPLETATLFKFLNRLKDNFSNCMSRGLQKRKFLGNIQKEMTPSRQGFQALDFSEMPRKGYHYEPRGWPPDEEGKQGVNQGQPHPLRNKSEHQEDFLRWSQKTSHGSRSKNLLRRFWHLNCPSLSC